MSHCYFDYLGDCLLSPLNIIWTLESYYLSDEIARRLAAC